MTRTKFHPRLFTSLSEAVDKVYKDLGQKVASASCDIELTFAIGDLVSFDEKVKAVDVALSNLSKSIKHHKTKE